MKAWFVLAVLACLPGLPARAAPETNGCIECHAAQPMPIWFGHTFEEWRSSLHAQRDVGGEKCHGGDPSASEADVAHRGVLSASDPASLVHVTRLQNTCGGCHEKQLAAFESTSHAHELREKGRGATCLTCHDAMAASLPSPASLDARCASCHAKPLRAKNALSMLAATKRRLRATRAELESARATDADWVGGALQRLDELQGTYRNIQLEWHAFETTKLFEDTRDVLALTDLLSQEVRRHGAMKARKAADEGARPAGR